ncbi:MAG: rhodanese-like domain-containing protein [Eubacteriales bacterium]|nr:rhodanese-like domain-containing protein [Eubacteriales bacterium]
MKKKTISMMMAVALMLSMTGCGSSTKETTGSGNQEATTGQESTTVSEVQVEAVEQRTVYVTPEWVYSAMNGDQEGYEDVVVAEVGYGDVKDCVSYKEGHIPGAIYVDNCEVEDATGDEKGAYNLLDAEVVKDNLLSHGITKDTKVILYGADASGTARQAYGYLWVGVEDVKIVNGGIDAWKAAGYDTETKQNAGSEAGDFGTEVPACPQYWTSIEEAKERLENDDNFKLVSIRSEDEWLGKTSGYNYIDKAGEPEGAVWGKGAETAFDVAGFTNEDGTIKNLEGLQEVWSDCDFTLENDLAFYCGTGWRASVPFLVLYENGYDNVSVYDGGWYQWIMNEDYPVQVGDPADEDCQHVTVADLPNDKAAK